MILHLTLVFLIAALTEGLLHYMPWQWIFGRRVGPPWAYVAGLLPLMAIAWAFTALCPQATALETSAAWTLAVVGGGGAVLLAYLLDGYLAERAKRQIWEAEHEEEA